MPLNLYTSNRMEVLVDTLAAALRQAAGFGVYAGGDSGAEWGMQRWLSMERKSSFKLCAMLSSIFH
jgi:hypothetical protein